MKSKPLFVVLLMALLATFVYAALNLVYEKEVQTCTDSDFGLNFSVTGTINGTALNGNPYSFTDVCKANNITVREGACRFNATAVYAQVWEKDCSDLNKTCMLGRCV